MSDVNLTAVAEPKYQIVIHTDQIGVDSALNLSLTPVEPLKLTVGLQGSKGDTGPIGPQGPQGPIGPQGPAGTNGLNGADSVVPGPQGPIGPVGPKGDTGDKFTVDAIGNLIDLNTYDAQAVGFTFLAQDTGNLYILVNSPGVWTVPIPFLGPQGPQGEQGIPGVAGPTGAQGAAGQDFSFDAVGPTIQRFTYNASPAGFTFLDSTTGQVFVRQSDTIGVWSPPFSFTGPQGATGAQGPRGYSPYEFAVINQGYLGTEAEWLRHITAYGVAVTNGYAGTEAQWLTSLTAYGIAVANGFVGTQAQWLTHINAYGIAVANGYVGTEADWLRHITAYGVAVTNGFVGTEQQWLDTLDGYGVALSNGFVGTKQEWLDSLSGYAIAVQNGFVGSQAAWLDSLVGPQGIQGIQGSLVRYGVVNPTTEGNDGDFYFNTATSFIFGPKAAGVWPAGVNLKGPKGDKGDIGEQGLSGNGTAPFLESRKRNNIIAGASQTVFSISTYNVGFLDVYLNGVLLIDTQDYIANDNFTVVLNTPAQAGDYLTAISYAQFEVASGNHDNLVGYEPDEHINWKLSQAPEKIHPDNLGLDVLRLPVGGPVSNISTDHPLQIGETALNNIVMDENTIMARNNGAVAPLNLNPGGAILGDGSQLTGISSAHRVLRYEDPTARTYGTGEAPGMVSPVFVKDVGSAVLVNITTPTRNDDGSWGGVYFRMEFSVDNAATWENLGNQGYEGNMVNSGDSIEPWVFIQIFNFPPILAADNFAIRMFHRTYSGTGYVGDPGQSGVAGGTNYSIGLGQITFMEIPL